MAKNNYFILIILLVFFCHGMLYFITGNIYDDSNPVKYIKYILLLFLFSKLPYSLYIKRNNCFFVLPFLLYFFIVMLVFVSYNKALYPLLMFMFPMSFFFIKDIVSYSTFRKVLYVTLILSFLFALLEITFFKDISSRFSSTGFRSISIFVNPNNFGVFSAIVLSLFLTDSTLTINSKILIWLTSTICIFLSGSMTAVVILGYFICIKILHAITHALSVLKIKKVYFYLLPCVMALIIVIAYLKMGNILRDTNEVGMDNVSARIGYLSEFFSALADNFLFPGLVHPDLYADNAYIYSWIITGLIGCLLFVIAITLMITLTLLNRSKRKYVLFFSALLLASMTTNIFNIWPIAYLFWAIAGYTLSTSSELSI